MDTKVRTGWKQARFDAPRLEGPAVAEHFVLGSLTVHRGIFAATTKCLAFALFRSVLKFL